MTSSALVVPSVTKEKNILDHFIRWGSGGR